MKCRVAAFPLVVASASLLAWMALGCAKLGPGTAGTPCPIEWVPSQAIEPGAASIRARMQLRVGGEEVHLEIISERRDAELVVVGLARFGVRLFALRQRGMQVEVESASSDELAQVAIWAMDALHRAYWIMAPSDPTPTSFRHGPETVLEFSTDHGRRREFVLDEVAEHKLGAQDLTRRVTIDYARTTVDSDMQPRVVAIRNPWCGYEAAIAPMQRATNPTR